MRRLLALFTAVACLFLVAVLAYRPAPAANVQEVLIGELLPLTGNFASLGQQYLWAGQTVEDIVNDLQIPKAEIGVMLVNSRHVDFDYCPDGGAVLAIFATVLAVNALGDYMRDALDPRLRDRV